MAETPEEFEELNRRNIENLSNEDWKEIEEKARQLTNITNIDYIDVVKRVRKGTTAPEDDHAFSDLLKYVDRTIVEKLKGKKEEEIYGEQALKEGEVPEKDKGERPKGTDEDMAQTQDDSRFDKAVEKMEQAGVEIVGEKTGEEQREVQQEGGEDQEESLEERREEKTEEKEDEMSEEEKEQRRKEIQRLVNILAGIYDKKTREGASEGVKEDDHIDERIKKVEEVEKKVKEILEEIRRIAQSPPYDDLPEVVKENLPVPVGELAEEKAKPLVGEGAHSVYDVVDYLENLSERERAKLSRYVDVEKLKRKLKDDRELSIEEKRIVKEIEEKLRGKQANTEDEIKKLEEELAKAYARFDEGKGPYPFELEERVKALREAQKALPDVEGKEAAKALPAPKEVEPPLAPQKAASPKPTKGEKAVQPKTQPPQDQHTDKEGKEEKDKKGGEKTAKNEKPPILAMADAIIDDYAKLLHAKEKIFKPFMKGHFKEALRREEEIKENYAQLVEAVLSQHDLSTEEGRRAAAQELNTVFEAVKERYNHYAGGLLWRFRSKKASIWKLVVSGALAVGAGVLAGPMAAAAIAGLAAVRFAGVFSSVDAVGDLLHQTITGRKDNAKAIGAAILYRNRNPTAETVLQDLNGEDVRAEVRELAQRLSEGGVKVAKEAMWVRIAKRAVGVVAGIALSLPIINHLVQPIPEPQPAVDEIFSSNIDYGEGVYHQAAEMVDKAEAAFGINTGNVNEEALRVALMRDLINEADHVNYVEMLNGHVAHADALSNHLEMVQSAAAEKWHGLPKDVWMTMDPRSTPGEDILTVDEALREKYTAFMKEIAHLSKDHYVDGKEVFSVAKKHGLNLAHFVKNPPAYVRP